MALFKMSVMNSGNAEMCTVTGSCVFTNTAASNNYIQPQSLTKAAVNASGASIGQNETVAPQGSKVVIVAQPTTAYSPQIATNANAASIAVLDLRGFPADIVSVGCGAVAPAPGTAGTIATTGYDCAVLGIDQVNNFIYVQLVTSAGVATTWGNGIALHYKVVFCDGYAP